MAIVIDFVNVVVCKAAAECRFPGGVDTLVRLGNYLEDENLVLFSFMSTADALRLAEQLKTAGLRYPCAGESDIAIVDGRTVQSEPWLSIGECEGHWACWLRERPPGRLIDFDPAMMLRWPGGGFRSLADLIEILRQPGVEIHERAVDTDSANTVMLDCVRGSARIEVEVFKDGESGRPLGVWGRRDPARRSARDADVALMRDLTAKLVKAGAEGGSR